MSLRSYRVLIIVFIVLGPIVAMGDLLCVPGAISIWIETSPLIASASLIGIVLQPVAAVGLWRVRRWGRVAVWLATAFSLASPGMILGPVIVLLFTPCGPDHATIERREDKS